MLKLTVSFLFSLIVLGAVAQQNLSEGTLTYKISSNSVDPNSTLAKSLEGATFTVYLKGTQSRTDMASALGSESNFFDSKTGKGVILKQYSGQKLMITMNAANFSQKNKATRNLNFKVSDQQVKMAGFNCNKAIGESATGKSLEVYFTSQVQLSNKQYDNALPQLDGLPVQYELQSGKIIFTYTLTNVNYEPVPAAKFEIPKAGYRVLTYEETQQLKSVEN